MPTNFYRTAANISQKFFFIKSNIVVKKGWSIKYIFYRISRPILKVYYWLFNLAHPQRPWTSPASILIFDKVLNKTMTGLEYGSGRSTHYFANKLQRLVSVEHHESWYEKVKTALTKNSLTNVDYRFVPKGKNGSDNEDFKVRHNGISKEFKARTKYKDYFDLVNEFDNDYFDFVLIDGRARVECALNSIQKIKSGGILVLDNSERARYMPIHKALKEWDKVNTTTGLTDTTFWFKP